MWTKPLAFHPLLLLTIQCHRGGCLKFSLYVPDFTQKQPKNATQTNSLKQCRVGAEPIQLAKLPPHRKTSHRGRRLEFCLHVPEIWERALPAEVAVQISHITLKNSQPASPKGEPPLKIYPFKLLKEFRPSFERVDFERRFLKERGFGRGRTSSSKKSSLSQGLSPFQRFSTL